MKGGVPFLVGIIGLSFFAAISALVPYSMRPNDGMVIFLGCLVLDFVFLNVMVVGFFRVLGHVHETVLYPEDAYYHPQRGRALFLVGYIGLLVTLAFIVMLFISEAVMRIHWGGRTIEMLLLIAWFVGWAFIGVMLGGILAMLGDIFRKAFYRSAVHAPDPYLDDDLNIARGASRRSRREED